MTHFWAVLAAFVVTAFLFVLASVVLRIRTARWVRCPETRMPAAVAVDARHAAWTGMWGRPLVRVRSCTLWPSRAGCAQRCCELPEISDDVRSRAESLR